MSNIRAGTYRGYSLQQIVDGEVRVDIRVVHGLDNGPRVRGVDTVIPSASGRVPRNRVADGRPVELEGFIAGVGTTWEEQLADFRAVVEELRAIFDPTLSPGALVVNLEDGGTATIDARALEGQPEWGDDNILTYRELGVDLEATEDWQITLAGS